LINPQTIFHDLVIMSHPKVYSTTVIRIQLDRATLKITSIEFHFYLTSRFLRQKNPFSDLINVSLVLLPRIRIRI